MKSWSLKTLGLKPRLPEILSSSDAARAIALDLAAGESLAEHQVHERAWLVVIDGVLEVGTREAGGVRASAGELFTFAPQEPHTVRAVSDSRLLLLLSPWPGEGHPGAMSLEEKANARENAAERAGR